MARALYYFIIEYLPVNKQKRIMALHLITFLLFLKNISYIFVITPPRVAGCITRNSEPYCQKS
jgi:hypothetical protein